MKVTNRYTPLLLFGSVSAKSCSDCLEYGTPESVGMLSQPLQDMVANISAYGNPANYLGYSYDEVYPIEPGAAVMVGHKSTIVGSFAVGKALLYADVNGTKLPENQQINASVDSIYDMASLTKLFTTIAALQQIEAGKLDINEYVATYVPAFATNNKQNVTILQLMTHTSGFPPDPTPGLYELAYYSNIQDRQYAIMMAALENAPGTAYVYSDLNFMNLMIVLETITGKKIDELIYQFTVPLGMTNTFFNRGNVEGPAFPFYNKMVAEEFQIAVLGPKEPQRPQPVRGTVHDENTWSLDGVSGHAGLFSTVGDTAIFCQMILNNGTYNGIQILKPETVDLIFYNFNTAFPGDEHGLGFELDQYYWSGPMANLECAGHTGFTGTTLAIDRASDTFFILFSNRVHPSREWSSNNIVREALGYWVATALGRDVAFPAL